mmetsp:Transcript_5372/g.11082  ORF Transcript_5372/g.11082 Transcript_5372/m.11082 type:complete len:133 (+) Transcript_5372:1900-2298(+)
MHSYEVTHDTLRNGTGGSIVLKLDDAVGCVGRHGHSIVVPDDRMDDGSVLEPAEFRLCSPKSDHDKMRKVGKNKSERLMKKHSPSERLPNTQVDNYRCLVQSVKTVSKTSRYPKCPTTAGVSTCKKIDFAFG